jgi:hypothetical protein
MIIRVNAGNDGWGKYVLEGTFAKPRDQDKIKLLQGDIELGDKISQATEYKQNEYKIILAFKGKVSDETLKGALEDFERLFMHGFEKDEYHLDAVLHRDTDDDHIHIRIPKLNLKTQTQLKLYIHKNDKKRKELIADYIDLKHGLESPRDNRKLVAEQRDEHINNWREEHSQEPLSFTSKKDRTRAVSHLNDEIRELHQAELINSLEDITEHLKSYELEVIKQDYDRTNDFHYITLQHETGKIRLKGDLYNAEFWGNSRADREAQITSDRTTRGTYERSNTEFSRVQNDLEKELNKRRKYVGKRYARARQRSSEALERIKTEYSQEPQDVSSGHQVNQTSVNSDISSIQPDSHNSSFQGISGNSEALTVASSDTIPTRERGRNKVYSYTERKNKDYRRQRVRPNQGELNERDVRSSLERLRAERKVKRDSLRRAGEERESLYSQFTANRLKPEQLRDRRGKFKTAHRARTIAKTVTRLGTGLRELTTKYQQLATGASDIRERFTDVQKQLYKGVAELSGKVEAFLEKRKEHERYQAPSQSWGMNR